MPTGDTLTLIGIAVGAVIGALSTSGWRSLVCWVLTAIFILWALGNVGNLPAAPSLAGIAGLITPLIAPVTIGIFALMTSDLRTPRITPDPPAAVERPKQLPIWASDQQTRWQPDLDYCRSFAHFWSVSDYTDASEALASFTNALRRGKVSAWGKEHPEDEQYVQIARNFWRDPEITPESNYVFSPGFNAGAYDVHLSKAEIEKIWPKKDEPKA